MRLVFILSSFVLAFMCFACSASSRITAKTTKICDVKLYYMLGGLGEEMKGYFSRDGFNRVVLFNQRRIIEKDNEWAIDEESFKTFIQKTLPDLKDNAVVVLNWEGEVLESIKGGEKSLRNEEARELFVKAYSIVKELRPRTEVGYYGLPIRDYWNRNENWRQKNRSLDPFLSNFDILFPSIYDFYDSSTNQGKGDLEYVHDNVEEALLASERLGKKVMPFVWHRYHTSNKKLGRSLIPLSEFSAHIEAATNTKVGGKRVDGIIWWSSEYSLFAKQNIGVIKDKVKLRAAWEREALGVLPKYYSALKEGVSRSCQK
jgi:hypothetical protein